MNNIFNSAFAYLIGDEGQTFVNDPEDAGGPTKFGITLRDLNQFLGKECTADDVASMNKETAAQIYEKFYWVPFGLDQLTNGVNASALFDVCVLYGGETGIKMAQEALNNCGQQLDTDGKDGVNTQAALNAALPSQFIPAFVDKILARIEYIIEKAPYNKKFKEGWVRRAERLLTLVA